MFYLYTDTRGTIADWDGENEGEPAAQAGSVSSKQR